MGDLSSLDEWQLLQRIAQRKGIPEPELIKRAIARISNGGKPNPEHAIEDAAAIARETKEELARMREEMAQRDRDAQMQAQSREEQMHLSRYQSSVIEAIDADSHPLISDYAPGTVAQMALQAANRYFKATGEIAPVEQVLDYLESQEQKAVMARIDKHATRFGWTKAEQQAAADVATQATPAVTNGDAAARGASPVDVRKASDRERIESAAEFLRAKRRAKR